MRGKLVGVYAGTSLNECAGQFISAARRFRETAPRYIYKLSELCTIAERKIPVSAPDLLASRQTLSQARVTAWIAGSG